MSDPPRRYSSTATASSAPTPTAFSNTSTTNSPNKNPQRNRRPFLSAEAQLPLLKSQHSNQSNQEGITTELAVHKGRTRQPSGLGARLRRPTVVRSHNISTRT